MAMERAMKLVVARFIWDAEIESIGKQRAKHRFIYFSVWWIVFSDLRY